MKKLIMLGILLMAGAGVASADNFSIGFSFGEDRPRYHRHRHYRPVYYYDDCGPRYYRSYYRPGYVYYSDRYWHQPRRRVVVYRDCD
jgi:hypothetical protein